MDCSPLGSSIHGIFQPRVLEWGAIAFSEAGVSRCVNLGGCGTQFLWVAEVTQETLKSQELSAVEDVHRGSSLVQSG